ncbi:YggT family protein [Rhizobium sp. No.120]
MLQSMGLARLVANVYMSVNRERETNMLALFQTIDLALNLYTWILIASAIFSWLYAFNVINSSNQFVSSVGNFLYAVTEPALRPIRRILPDLGGIDISPVILLLIIFFIRSLMWNSIVPLFLR